MPPLLTDAQISEARDRIVAVAERMIVEGGAETLSMHGIARQMGWTATALYRYFDSKEAVVAAARVAAYDRLSSRLEAATAGPGDAWARSRAVGDAYLGFAMDDPYAYRLLFSMSQPDPQRYPDLVAAMQRSRVNLTRYVEQLVEESDLDADPVMLAHLLWAGLHGLISLHMAGKTGPDAPSFEQMRREMMRHIFRGARALSPSTNQNPE
ncbi:MAG: TetR/AcrR family transcriptional regulator [Sphingobium sp.]